VSANHVTAVPNTKGCSEGEARAFDYNPGWNIAYLLSEFLNENEVIQLAEPCWQG